jgi:UDP-3-O-[3-hydroxymyristoyl] glucosamine N-acyltransferase
MLNIRLTAVAIALTAAVGAVAPAHAQLAASSGSLQSSNAPSTYIGGNVDIDAQTNVLACIVLGDNSKCKADQGIVYESTYIGGNLRMDCRSNVQVGVVLGDNSHASASQCSIGAPK